jgi:hypothetical protein
MTRRPHFRRLQCQALESRNLMAGNVNVAVVGGDLVVTGDANANGIAILQLGPGQYEVLGRLRQGLPTTITKAGVAGDSQELMNVTGDFEIRLQDGSDVLVIDNTGLAAGTKLLVPRNLNVSGAGGNDDVQLTDVRVVGDATFHLATGNDFFSMIRGFIGANRGISDSDLTVNGGGGNDTARIHATIVRDDLYLPLGHGTNKALLKNSSVQGNATIATGDGSDRVDILSTSVRGQLLVHTGAGADEAGLISVGADSIFAQMGDGDVDFLHVSETEAENAKFDGGSGHHDTLDYLGTNTFTNSPVITGFE